MDVRLGEQIYYEFHTEKSVGGQEVELELIAYDGWGIDNTWRERIVAEQVEKQTFRVPWVVKLDEHAQTDELHPPIEIQCRAVGLGGETERLRLDVRNFKLTEQPLLRKLMFHEFHKPEGGGWVFDPDKPQTFLDNLTPEQRRLLYQHPIDGGKDARLVVFATLIPLKERDWIRADYCGGKPSPAKANASFAVFRCQRGRDIELICYTRYLLINGLNTTTRKQFRKLDRAGDLKRDNPSPPRYVLACGLPNHKNHHVPWIRIFTPDGVDFMPEGNNYQNKKSNSIHGLMNTIGCWMLFRNYNWPTKDPKVFDGLHKVYLNVYRKRPPKRAGEAAKERWKKRVIAACAKVEGYTPQKMLFDRNAAYAWMLRDVLGLKFWGEDKWKTNDYKTHGEEFEATKPEGYTYTHPRTNGTHAGYATVEAFVYTDDLWGENVYGDKQLGVWARDMVRGKDRIYRLENVKQASFADIYFFREPGAPLPRVVAGE